uniref:Uncharacterized protein n=1 Tax=Setaria viridis TaxID=4556 RepID=A0A4U6TR96_SETVI|nr:hypothetical protein SEVIR_7G007800v2 [Setaria viridis]
MWSASRAISRARRYVPRTRAANELVPSSRITLRSSQMMRTVSRRLACLKSPPSQKPTPRGKQEDNGSLTLGSGSQQTFPVHPLGHGGLKPLHLHMEPTDLRPKVDRHLLNLNLPACLEVVFLPSPGLFSNDLEFLGVKVSLLDNGLELILRPPGTLPRLLRARSQVGTILLGGEDRAARTFASPSFTARHLLRSPASSSTKRGLCGSSRDIQRKVSPPHALGSRPTGTRAREASPAGPNSAVPDVAATTWEALPADPDAADPDVAAGVGATALDIAAPIIAAGAGTTTLDAAGPVNDAGARAAVSAAVAVVAAGARAAVFTAAASIAVARAGATLSATVAVSTDVVATPAAGASDADTSPTGSSSASSLRFISSPGGGTLGTASCPAGSAAEVEGGTGVAPCSVPDYGTLPPVAATEAASAGGPATSPTSPPAASRVTVRPAEAIDTRTTITLVLVRILTKPLSTLAKTD